ncbi:unnamed protein product [Durusdinium trenchii]|uniref:Rhomboid-like protein n=2 Tax=Durusdinium trenchii TaxID=1381693 RepID=A0ABP0PAQ8_9DINO
MIVLFETMSCRSEAAVFFSQGNGYIFAASRDHRLPLLNLLRLSLAALSGMGLVLLGFFIIKVNLLGMLHGNFFVTPTAQCMSRGLILFASLAGAILSHLSSAGCTGIIGAGANIGFLTGNMLLSCLTGHWKHALSTFAMIAVMCLTMWFSPIVWRQQFLILCGGIGLLMLPERRPWQIALLIILIGLSMSGLELIYAFYKGNDLHYWEAFCEANGLVKGTTEAVLSTDLTHRLTG